MTYGRHAIQVIAIPRLIHYVFRVPYSKGWTHLKCFDGPLFDSVEICHNILPFFTKNLTISLHIFDRQHNGNAKAQQCIGPMVCRHTALGQRIPDRQHRLSADCSDPTLARQSLGAWALGEKKPLHPETTVDL